MTSSATYDIAPDETSEPELAAAVANSVRGCRSLAQTGFAKRAELLRAIAAALEGAASELVELAIEESGLTLARLNGELARTTFQLRFFADIVVEGAFLKATIDHADPSWPPAPRPDLRRMLQPLGPVVVFAGSNFPFAFSVAGGDTASALAAGCAVLLKVHPGHPRLSAATGALVRQAAEAVGLPADVFQLIYGESAGRAAVVHPAICAASFTGSIRGGRALFDLASSRPAPIPFYGELGSLNPVFVTPTAATERLAEIAAGFRDSFTLGTGQFCTKPGLLVLPHDVDLEVLSAGLSDSATSTMLSERIRGAYSTRLSELTDSPDVDPLVLGTATGSRNVTPTLLVTTVEAAIRDQHNLLAECFGPVSVVALYRDESELLDLVAQLEGQLTATVFGSEQDPLTGTLVSALAEHAGRVIVGGWPTGVAVSWAMQHGGPYPATTAPTSTSVGAAAIERFLRPVAYQSVPDALLPPPLRESNPLSIPRLVDGRLILGPNQSTRSP
jgi:NADP-dependent aldehyde dehydrogenase